MYQKEIAVRKDFCLFIYMQSFEIYLLVKILSIACMLSPPLTWLLILMFGIWRPKSKLTFILLFWQEKIQTQVSALVTEIVLEKEKFALKVLQVQKYADAMREVDRKIDVQYQRKMWDFFSCYFAMLYIGVVCVHSAAIIIFLAFYALLMLQVRDWAGIHWIWARSDLDFDSIFFRLAA